jgi:hypothetical protein
MKTDKKNAKGEPMVRNIAHESRATHKVVVIDKKNSPPAGPSNR